MDEKKEILELLNKIEKSNRRQTICCTLLCLCALVIALCCIVTFGSVNQLLLQFDDVMPQITSAIPEITGVIDQMQTVLGNLETTTEQLAAMDLSSMVADVDALVITGQQSLEQTMKKLEAIDFDTLNKAIKDLAAVVEPLAKISNVFK